MNKAPVLIFVGLFLAFFLTAPSAADLSAKSYANEANQHFKNHNMPSFLQTCIIWDKKFPSFQSSFNLAFAFLMTDNTEKASNQIAALKKQYTLLTDAQNERLQTLESDISARKSYLASREYIRSGEITLSVPDTVNSKTLGHGSKDLMKMQAESAKQDESKQSPVEKTSQDKLDTLQMQSYFQSLPPLPVTVPEMLDE